MKLWARKQNLVIRDTVQLISVQNGVFQVKLRIYMSNGTYWLDYFPISSQGMFPHKNETI